MIDKIYYVKRLIENNYLENRKIFSSRCRNPTVSTACFFSAQKWPSLTLICIVGIEC